MSTENNIRSQVAISKGALAKIRIAETRGTTLIYPAESYTLGMGSIPDDEQK